MASIQSLYTIRDLISPVANIAFFIDINNLGIGYEDDELATIIKADNYTKTKQRVAEFVARKKASLEDFKQQTVMARQSELEDAQRKADSNRPSSAPSDLFLDKSDNNALNRYNEKVNEYNNRLELHRRLTDQRDRVKERYEDAIARFKEKQDEAEEQIREKKEELKPALDRDMAAFLGKLQQLVYDCFHNKALIFESFILLFMAKKAYIFLYDRIESNSDRNTASNTFRQLNGELEALIENHTDDLKYGFVEIVTYIYESFKENEIIFDALQEQLGELPYDICSANDESAHSLASLLVDTNFQYKDIIDPNELSRLEGQIRDRHEKFNNNISEIDSFINNIAITLDNIAEVLANSKAKHQQMCQNKETKLGEAFEYSRFVLGVFNEEIQDEYLKQQKVLLEAMQLEIETSLGTNLPKLLKTILETELLSVLAIQAINNNPAFTFLEYRQKLQQKRQELKGGIGKLEQQLQEIAKQPNEKAEEFAKKVQMLLLASLVPIGNLVTLFPLNQKITEYLPALSSGHPVYAELRKKAISKFQGFTIAHALITILIGGGTFAVKDEQKPFVIGGAASYAVSTGILFLKKKQLTNL